MGPTIETLNELAASWSGSILRATWQGGLAIAAAWVLVRCRPGLPPRVACWAWRLTDLKLMVALLWATPLLLPLLPPSARPERPAGTRAAPDLAPSPAVGSGPIPSRAEGPAASPAFVRPSPACVALLFWLSGVVGAAVLAGREGRAVARLRRSCSPIDGPDLRDAATDLARALGLRSVPELRSGPAVARPMLVCALRPAILLPAAMLRGPRSAVALRPVLAHELAHARRRDLLWSGLAAPVRALFFFHPLVWLAHREALLAREAACDALALRVSGVRPSEYGRILLDIAAGGPERPSRWAATLGMAGSTGILKRRLMAMKTNRPPSRRRLLSWAFALLAIGAAGVIPWQLVPREALAQDPPAAPPATGPVRDGEDERPSTAATEGEARLKVAEAGIEVAQAERKVAEFLVEQAEAEATRAAAMRKFRGKELDRYVQLEKRRAVPQQLVDEHEARFREAQAAEHETKAKFAISRDSLEAARATVREAEALRDIARVESMILPAPVAEDDLKAARARLRAARLDRARFERDAAGADEIARAEASLEKARVAVESRTKQYERYKHLAQKRAVPQEVVDKQEQALTEARYAERAAEAAVGLARARLEAAEARFKAAEAGAAEPISSPPIPRR